MLCVFVCVLLLFELWTYWDIVDFENGYMKIELLFLIVILLWFVWLDRWCCVVVMCWVFVWILYLLFWFVCLLLLCLCVLWIKIVVRKCSRNEWILTWCCCVELVIIVLEIVDVFVRLWIYCEIVWSVFVNWIIEYCVCFRLNLVDFVFWWI